MAMSDPVLSPAFGDATPQSGLRRIGRELARLLPPDGNEPLPPTLRELLLRLDTGEGASR